MFFVSSVMYVIHIAVFLIADIVLLSKMVGRTSMLLVAAIAAAVR
jgi:hypothetical protein